MYNVRIVYITFIITCKKNCTVRRKDLLKVSLVSLYLPICVVGMGTVHLWPIDVASL